MAEGDDPRAGALIDILDREHRPEVVVDDRRPLPLGSLGHLSGEIVQPIGQPVGDDGSVVDEAFSAENGQPLPAQRLEPPRALGSEFGSGHGLVAHLLLASFASEKSHAQTKTTAKGGSWVTRSPSTCRRRAQSSA